MSVKTWPPFCSGHVRMSLIKSRLINYIKFHNDDVYNIYEDSCNRGITLTLMLRLFKTFQQILTSAMIPFFLKNPLPHADEATAPSGLFSYRPYIFRGESVRLSVWLFVQIQHISQTGRKTRTDGRRDRHSLRLRQVRWLMNFYHDLVEPDFRSATVNCCQYHRIESQQWGSNFKLNYRGHSYGGVKQQPHCRQGVVYVQRYNSSALTTGRKKEAWFFLNDFLACNC